MKHLLIYLAAILFSLSSSAQDAPSSAQDVPSSAQDVPSSALDAPSSAQDASSTALNTPSSSPSPSSPDVGVSDGFAAGIPSKSEADSAYANEDFIAAARIYRLLLDSCGGSAQLYYNLGNCYFRQDSVARAILCYERARLLDPSDDDIRFNLEMARAKTVDRVMPASEMFFVSLFHRMVLSLSIQTWAWLGLLSFLLMLCAIAAYFFLPTLAGKKVGFTAAVISLLICLFANIAAYQQLHQLENRGSAVIMTSSAVVKSTPSTSGTDLFILHEGTRVEIEDDTMNEWVEIRMSDGKEGWLQRSEIEII